MVFMLKEIGIKVYIKPPQNVLTIKQFQEVLTLKLTKNGFSLLIDFTQLSIGLKRLLLRK